MAHTPEQSAIKMTKELEEKIANGSTEEIKEYLKQAAVDQGLVTRDYYSPDVLLEVEGATSAPQKFARAVVIDGKKHIIEGDSELALEKNIGDFYRAQMQPAATQQTQQPRDTTTGRFVEQGKADEKKAALDLQFRLGQISSADYLEQSGAIDEYLAKAGVPLEDLKSAVEEKQNQRYEKSWTQAVEEFKNSPVGANWPGGQKNVEIIGRIIEQQGWTDEENKAAVLEAAFRYARENNLLLVNEEAELERRISEATSASELASILQPAERREEITRRSYESSSAFNYR